MNTPIRFCLCQLAFLFFSSAFSLAASSPTPPAENTPAVAERLPGVDLAAGITQLTGVAISPLLGVSAVGAWQYYQAPEARRSALPWFCQPYVWGAGFCLLALCFLKDLFGTAAPPLIKKPLDVVELFENKISALVACSAFLPFVVSQMAQHASTVQASIPHSPDLHLASIGLAAGFGFDVRFITIPLAIIGFLVVWLACHAINVLIALCPFGLIDGLLKLFKAALLASVVASSFISPFFGAVVSLVILFAAGLIAPWAFRLTVFGTLFGLDVMLPGRGRKLVRATEPHAFLARKVAAVPVRTYGRLTRGEKGEVTFSFRPWLILPERSITIPAGSVAIAKGVLFPSLLHASEDQKRRVILVIFLPRYRSHEHSIASHFEILDIEESPIMKGIRAMRVWLAETFSVGSAKYAAARNTGLSRSAE